MNYIKFGQGKYPEYQAQGFASRFIFPFAELFCKGTGFDIGCSRPEWALRGAVPIDLTIDDPYDAFHLPDIVVDYVFSSHCLEHIPRWTDAVDYWLTKLRPEGTIFLYLPHYSQEYWRPWNCQKHVHAFTQDIVVDFLKSRGLKNVHATGVDLNHSFAVVGEK